jgi:glutamate-1-semialdehyde aminotransferase
VFPAGITIRTARKIGQSQSKRIETRGEKAMKLEKSKELHKRALGLIPGGSQMFNKRPLIYEPAEYPDFADRSEGSHLYDVDGNKYIDYLLAYGAIHLGYNYAPVMDSVTDQIRRGTIHSVNDPLEITLAEEICSTIPGAQMVRYFLSGSEATSAAVRIAQAHTNRKKIVTYGYHGWHDWTRIVRTGPTRGMADYLDMIHCPVESITHVPEEVSNNTLELEYNNLGSLENLMRTEGDEIACIIMEPFYFELPEKGFLEGVRDTAHRYGSVLLFDEVKTGMRVSLGGAQEYLGVTPDISVFSKAIANGYPFSLVAGKREYMRACESLWFAGTNCGNAVGISAALATIRESRRVGACDHIWKLGERIMKGMQELLARYEIPAEMGGLPPMPFLTFKGDNREMKKKLTGMYLSGLISRGVFMPLEHCFYISFSHTVEDIDHTLNAIEESFKAIKKSI